MNGVDRAVRNSPPACPDLDQEEPHPDELAMALDNRVRMRPSITGRSCAECSTPSACWACDWCEIAETKANECEMRLEAKSSGPNEGVAPRTAAERKNIPLARGLLDYFPLALMAVAELSRIGNEQHNPGEPIHWARDKSTDHADCVMRHMIDRGKLDVDQVRHTTKVAWRALALLQTELENAQPVSRAPVRVEWGEPARSRLADDPQGFGR